MSVFSQDGGLWTGVFGVQTLQQTSLQSVPENGCCYAENEILNWRVRTALFKYQNWRGGGAEDKFQALHIRFWVVVFFLKRENLQFTWSWTMGSKTAWGQHLAQQFGSRVASATMVASLLNAHPPLLSIFQSRFAGVCLKLHFHCRCFFCPFLLSSSAQFD